MGAAAEGGARRRRARRATKRRRGMCIAEFRQLGQERFSLTEACFARGCGDWRRGEGGWSGGEDRDRHAESEVL